MSNVRRGDELSNTCKNPASHSPCCRRSLPLCEIQGTQRSSRLTGIRHAKEEPADQCREKNMKSNLNCSLNLFMLLTAISFSTAAATQSTAPQATNGQEATPAGEELTWPREFVDNGTKVDLYQPEIEKWEGMVNRQELSMPPTITVEQMKGFSLYMIKAVLDGRGTKILDLAKTNLLR